MPRADRTKRPPRLDTFLGRDREVAEVCDLLDTFRLVTLSGPGGSGKTRLAEEVAAELASRTGVDTAVVELAPVEDVAMVPVRSRPGWTSPGSRPCLRWSTESRSAAWCCSSTTWSSSSASDRWCPSCCAGLEGCGSWPPRGSRCAWRASRRTRSIRSTSGPGRADPERLAASPAMALLEDRARSRNRALRVKDSDGPVLRDVVRALDGLPLALEIAAPWLAALGPVELLGELAHPLDLDGRQAGSDRRHRTLRATIAWSHDRLTRDKQRLLRRMSVLRGSGDLDAVRAVGGDDLGSPVGTVLLDLLDRDLVRAPSRSTARRGSGYWRPCGSSPRSGSTRRASGRTRSCERPSTSRGGRYSSPVTARVRTPIPGSRARPVRTPTTCGRRWTTFHPARPGTSDRLQLVVDTWALWFELGFEREGERRLQTALDAAPHDAPARAIGLVYLANFVGLHDHADRALAMAQEAIAIARPRRQAGGRVRAEL